MRANLFKSAGSWAVSLIVGFSAQKQRESNNARQNNDDDALWSVLERQKELDSTKLQAEIPSKAFEDPSDLLLQVPDVPMATASA